LIDYLRFEEYESRWSWLSSFFTPDAVRLGSMETLAGSFKDRKRLIPIGAAFLNEIEEWRLDLAKGACQMVCVGAPHPVR
jgi:hypothetical protein